MVELFVISCGGTKLATPAPAHRLYSGSYFQLQLRWARSQCSVDRIRVLSARYGLVPLTERLVPYDLRMGAPGSVTAAQIAEALPPRVTVVTSCGDTYVRPLREAVRMVGGTLSEPLKSARGMGPKRSLMLQHIERRKLQ